MLANHCQLELMKQLKIPPVGISGLVLAALILASSSALATSLTVQNFSFEGPVLADGANQPNPPGWTLNNAGNEYNPTSSQFATAAGNGTPTGADGIQVASSNGGQGTALLQALAGDDGILGNGDDPLFAPNTTYTLTVAVGQRLDLPFTGYALELVLLDGTVIATEVSAITPAPGTFVDRTISVDSNTVAPIHYGQQIRINLTTAGFYEVNFDNVRVSAVTVPEPSSVVLAVLGFIGIAAWGWRRRAIA